ncbi:MAG TPA: glycosyltransferase, partial [Candidatus Binatus sp.]|nr:glycosyltransferase [Candidatus Binatus sp.]
MTEFTYSRFLVPHLCDYRGAALFLDADMIVLADISELFDLFDEQYSVQVVQNKLKFEWPSMMLFNCAKCERLTPEFVQNGEPFAFEWGSVGNLPSQWNHLVGYDEPRGEAKIVHFTQGIPCFK